MPPQPTADVFSPREIARAAAVSVDDAVAVIGRRDALLPWADAVRLGRALARHDMAAAIATAPRPLFARVDDPVFATGRVPLVISSTLHLGGIAAFVLVASLAAPHASTLGMDEHVVDPARLVYLVAPGPGGGGGGGGAQQRLPPPKALSEGHHRLSSPLPARESARTLTAPQAKPTPIPAEQLPAVLAPIVRAPSDPRTQAGTVDATDARADSRGPGAAGGVGSGNGTGIGEGNGAGIGPGSGGGTGGGPYRPGSGIEPPRVVREVKADYTEDARRRGISGDVVLEIVVRRNGTVSDVRVLQGLDPGLDGRAIDAVRQWRFAPATRLGVPVDVMVEVAVEFRLR